MRTREQRLEVQRRYARSPKGRATLSAYKRSTAGRVSQAVYDASPKGIVRRKESNRRHALQVAARSAVSNAKRDGKLIRKPCEVCGKKAQAHHDDYNKPLDVRWLCQKHHTEIHLAFSR